MTTAAAPRSPSTRLPSVSGYSGSVLRVALVVSAVLASGSLARADCAADFGKLMARRMTEVTALNQISKTNGGKLDPVAACPRLKQLAAVETEVVAYMDKNKDWCNLPDDLVTKMTASRAKSASFAVKACGFAVKMKQMQQQQAQQQQQQPAVKLPTGPL